jgi:hypothetical protein
MVEDDYLNGQIVRLDGALRVQPKSDRFQAAIGWKRDMGECRHAGQHA